MKVLLIFTDFNSEHMRAYHPGLASISSYLKKHNHQVKLKYIYSKEQYDSLLEFVTEYMPDVVGFTAVETQFIYVTDIAKLIKQVHNCLIICGGVYVTLSPDCVKKARYLDGIIRGEGEYAMVELLNKLEKGEDYRNTKNFCYYDEDKDLIVMNPIHPLIEDLDSLPFMARDSNYQKIIDSFGYILFYFSRGCPYKCAYCCNHALAKVYGYTSKKIRVRSPESCIAEIKYVLNNFNCKSSWKRKKFVLIEDDLFTSDKKWLYNFLSLYKKEINMPFYCHTRSNLASKEMFAKLKDAGCFRIMMSIESGNEFIRNKVMNRGISDEVLFNSFKLAHEAGLETNGVCIIGLPFETKEKIEDTIRVAALTNTTSCGVSIFYPYSGTDLKRVCEENGFLPEDYESYEITERRESVLNLPTISKEEILFYHKNWENLVWAQRPLSIRKIQALLISKLKLRKYSILRRIYHIAKN